MGQQRRPALGQPDPQQAVELRMPGPMLLDVTVPESDVAFELGQGPLLKQGDEGGQLRVVRCGGGGVGEPGRHQPVA